MTLWGVEAYFMEGDTEVYDILGPLDRYLAELLCVSMADGMDRGGRWVHVTRARVVPWL